MYCAECKKRDTCRVLCSGAEAYVSQDHVSQREPTFSGMANRDGGDVDLDVIAWYGDVLSGLDFKRARPERFPLTFSELTGAKKAVCRSCKKVLSPPLAPNQKVCRKCMAENTRAGWRKAQQRAREKARVAGVNRPVAKTSSPR